MTNDQTYNGWKTYETWAAYTWLTNDEGSYNLMRETAQEFKEQAPNAPQVADGIWTVEQAAKFTFADWLKDYVEDNSPLNDSATLYTDLLNAAIGEIDWHELAEGLAED